MNEKDRSFLFCRLDLLSRTDPGESIRNVEYMMLTRFCRVTLTGLERPGGEVVTEDLDEVLEVDFKRRLLGVHCLLLAFFLEVILFFNGLHEPQHSQCLFVLSLLRR
jgi:hypothetical protein